jgi:alpha-L-fucosidase
MNRRTFLTVFAICTCSAVGLLGQASPSGDPLKRTTPGWFDEAKLGIFIHWNAAAIPAYAPVTSLEALRADAQRDSTPDPDMFRRKLPYAEMYQAALMIPGSATARYHKEHFGDMPYDEFVERFRDEMIPGWDPKPWATLFERSGARYVVLTTKTEDGFLLWPSAQPNPHKPNWQSKRDVVGELAEAVRAEGLRFATYYSGGSDWTFGGLGPNQSLLGGAHINNEAYRAYVDRHWRELIERYKPVVMWNDYAYPGEFRNVPADKRPADVDPAFRKHVESLFRFYLERVPEGVINNRFDFGWQGSGKLYTDFVTPEYSTDPNTSGVGREKGVDLKWEVCRGIGGSFGYNHQETDEHYMSSAELIHMFVDIVARGGNLLINVGPTATGEIPWLQAQRLLDLGWWLRTNGEAIYGTRPWVRMGGTTGEGLEMRYTSKKDTVFAILFGTPKTRVVEVDLRLDKGVKVSLEGTSGALQWSETPVGVRIDLPVLPYERPAMTLRLSPASGVKPAR